MNEDDNNDIHQFQDCSYLILEYQCFFLYPFKLRHIKANRH